MVNQEVILNVLISEEPVSGLKYCDMTPIHENLGIRVMLHWCPLIGNAKHQSPMVMYVHNSQGTARVVLFHQSTTKCPQANEGDSSKQRAHEQMENPLSLPKA
jgi:hypothetical protein